MGHRGPALETRRDVRRGRLPGPHPLRATRHGLAPQPRHRRPSPGRARRHHRRDQVRRFEITPLIARRGTEHCSGLGVHCWLVEGAIGAVLVLPSRHSLGDPRRDPPGPHHTRVRHHDGWPEGRNVLRPPDSNVRGLGTLIGTDPHLSSAAIDSVDSIAVLPVADCRARSYVSGGQPPVGIVTGRWSLKGASAFGCEFADFLTFPANPTSTACAGAVCSLDMAKQMLFSCFCHLLDRTFGRQLDGNGSPQEEAR